MHELFATQLVSHGVPLFLLDHQLEVLRQPLSFRATGTPLRNGVGREL